MQSKSQFTCNLCLFSPSYICSSHDASLCDSVRGGVWSNSSDNDVALWCFWIHVFTAKFCFCGKIETSLSITLQVWLDAFTSVAVVSVYSACLADFKTDSAKSKLQVSHGVETLKYWQFSYIIVFHVLLTEWVLLLFLRAVCSFSWSYSLNFKKSCLSTDSAQTASNKLLGSFNLQSVLDPEVEQLQRSSPFLGWETFKDLYSLNYYNEYVPVAGDLKKLVRQVEEAVQKDRGGTGNANPMESSSYIWARYPRRKRESLGLAGMCCKWGCTKAEISSICRV